jgi:hypothetical protein
MSDRYSDRVLTLALRSTSLPVELVEWPTQAGLRKALANAGIPRVLLVQPADDPPTPLGVDEDWVTADAGDDEIDRCARALLERLSTRDAIESMGDGVWSHLGRSFRLTPIQGLVFAELVAQRGTTVTHERLTAVGWPGKPVNLVALDTAMQRIREQLVGTGLFVRTVRCVGYALA